MGRGHMKETRMRRSFAFLFELFCLGEKNPIYGAQTAIFFPSRPISMGIFLPRNGLFSIDLNLRSRFGSWHRNIIGHLTNM